MDSPGSLRPQPEAASTDSDRLAASLPLPALSDPVSIESQPETQPCPVGAIENFADVLPEFVLLSERVSARNLFSEPEWIEAYLKAFEPSAEVLALTARQNGRLTGILPLVRTFEQWYGFPARILRPPGNSHSPSFEVLREDGAFGAAALRAIFSTLRSVDEWDMMELPRLPASGNTLNELLLIAREKAWHAARAASRTNLFVRLPLGVGKKIDAPWQSNVTAGQRKDLHRSQNLVKTELDGWICFETILHPTVEQLRLFFELESLGWPGVKTPAMLSDKPFYSEISRAYARSGRFMLNFLFLQDQAVAGQIGVRTGDALYALKWGYDERFSRYSPVSLLINGMLRLCWESGIRRFEMGPDSDYKRRWTNQEFPLASFFLFRPGFYGRILHDYKFLARPRLKQALTHLRLASGTK